MPMSDVQANQALFLETLLKIAYNRAALSSNNERTKFTHTYFVAEGQSYPEPLKKVGFDLRGRAIIDLVITPLIVSELKHHFKLDANDDESELKKAIGINYSPIIRCHLCLDPGIQDEDIQAEIGELNNQENQNNQSFPFHPHKMSIIPLYEELLSNIERHDAAVRAQMQELQILSEDLTKVLDEAFEKAREAIQTEVNHCSASITKLDVNEMNKRLDKARAEHENKIKTIWFETVQEGISYLDFRVRKTILEALASPEFAQIYAKTSAHQHDIIGTNHANGMVCYITNSDNRTARNEGEEASACQPALRFLIRNKWSKTGKVTMRTYGQALASVSTFSDVRLKKEEDISRIIAAYTHFHQEFDKFSGSSQDAKRDEEPSGKPIVYNVLSSLDSFLEERRDKKNSHNESTRRILAAAHRYNKEIKTGKYLWVQNLSFNHQLGNWFALPVHKEVALMADIALLYTLQDNFDSPDLKGYYDSVLRHYNYFLNQSQSLEDFYKSDEGRQAAKIISTCKKSIIEKALILPIGASPTYKVKLALLKMFSKDEHYRKKFGPLTQALSSFLEKKSVAGCSTGNTWHEDIQKRAGFLISSEECLPPELDVVFNDFIQNPRSKPDRLDNALAQHVNTYHMYGDGTAISPCDEGIPSNLSPRSSSSRRLLWLGTSSLGLTCTVVVKLNFALLLAHPLGFALSLSFGIFGLAVSSSAIRGFGLKAPYMNHVCSPLMTNYINDNLVALQSEHATTFIINKAKAALQALTSGDSSMMIKRSLTTSPSTSSSWIGGSPSSSCPLSNGSSDSDSDSDPSYEARLHYEGPTPPGFECHSSSRIVPTSSVSRGAQAPFSPSIFTPCRLDFDTIETTDFCPEEGLKPKAPLEPLRLDVGARTEVTFMVH